MNKNLEDELLLISDLESRAYQLVKYLFLERVDKAGCPYIMHLERVRDKFQDSFFRIIALLHDVVEDTDFTFLDLERLGFGGSYLEVLELLTKSSDIGYHEYISRIIHSKNKTALLIKIADMEDNMSDVRLNKLDKDLQMQLLEKYSMEFVRLMDAKGEMKLC